MTVQSPIAVSEVDSLRATPRARATQLEKLDALLKAAAVARDDARKGVLFASYTGLALTNAAFDLFECNELYDQMDATRRELGLFE